MHRLPDDCRMENHTIGTSDVTQAPGGSNDCPADVQSTASAGGMTRQDRLTADAADPRPSRLRQSSAPRSPKPPRQGPTAAARSSGTSGPVDMQCL